MEIQAMIVGRSETNGGFFFLASILSFFAQPFSRRTKIHDFTQQRAGVDYVFEVTEQDTLKGYMTGCVRDVRERDQILLTEESVVVQYQVEKIDYYASPPGLWIALLERM